MCGNFSSFNFYFIHFFSVRQHGKKSFHFHTVRVYTSNIHPISQSYLDVCVKGIEDIAKLYLRAFIFRDSLKCVCVKYFHFLLLLFSTTLFSSIFRKLSTLNFLSLTHDYIYETIKNLFQHSYY